MKEGNLNPTCKNRLCRCLMNACLSPSVHSKVCPRHHLLHPGPLPIASILPQDSGAFKHLGSWRCWKLLCKDSSKLEHLAASTPGYPRLGSPDSCGGPVGNFAQSFLKCFCEQKCSLKPNLRTLRRWDVVS